MTTCACNKPSEIQPEEVDRLRQLARTVKALSERDDIAEKREAIRAACDLKPVRPIVKVNPEGAWREINTPDRYACVSELGKEWETQLITMIYWGESIRDDTLIPGRFAVPWVFHRGDWGIDFERTASEDQQGAYHIESACSSPAEALDRLHFREPRIDREETERRYNLAAGIFDGILPVEKVGNFWWTTGLTHTAINILGMEGFMMAMYDAPEDLKALMRFLSEEMRHFMTFFEREGVLSWNNRGNDVGSGGCGLTSDLSDPGYPVPISSMWGLSESQETVGISPEMFGEFVLPYQKPLMERFGKVYYGCCEAIDSRLSLLLDIPNLHALSVSPWSDMEAVARAVGDTKMFMRKPNPSLVCASRFEEQRIREDLRETGRIFSGKSLQVVLKDTHTIANEPDRFRRWVEIAREELDQEWRF